ncbi:MAG TPA: hypothetical protein VK666_21705 [Chryseolinea sp.]|nr:hypothetical protein [Chryseolinea sp.]
MDIHFWIGPEKKPYIDIHLTVAGIVGIIVIWILLSFAEGKYKEYKRERAERKGKIFRYEKPFPRMRNPVEQSGRRHS